MSDIKFNCPQCGQSLAVDATVAGATVACPNCGQNILVPQLKPGAAKPEPPTPTKWWMVVAGVVIVALLAASVLIWQNHRRPANKIASAPVATPESPEAKEKEKWTRSLNLALRDLQTNNDQVSENLVSGILASLNQPGGLAPDALAGDVQRLKDRAQDLVRQGAWDSAVTLNLVQCGIGANADIVSPPHPNHKTGGNPGPGGLVLYLPLDKPDDHGIVHDESGAGNDGYVFGAQWVPDGKFGGAYRFSLTNFDDRIVVSNSDTLNPDSITIAAWVKTPSMDGFWHYIVDKYGTSGYFLGLAGDGWNGEKLWGRLYFQADPSVAMISRQTLGDNLWHHVAATFDGKTECIYVDGVAKSRLTKKPGPLRKSDWDLCIGNTVVNDATEQVSAFDGLIDEVRIYNRALSADEIKSLATGTQTGVDVSSAPVQETP